MSNPDSGTMTARALLPHYQFSESHQRHGQASPASLLQATLALDHSQLPLVKAAIFLRELPGRLSRQAALQGRAPFGMQEFTLLHQSDEQLHFGLVGRFWRPDFGLETIADAQAFTAFRQPGIAKLLLSFYASRTATGDSLLQTDTRIFCPDRRSQLLFTPYWYLIRPVSGLIRQRILATIIQQAQALHR